MSSKSGRPREFTHPKRCELLDHIGQGATVEEAAQIVGVSLRTVQREARHNEFFDHDLHLALHAAPVDPHQLMLRAARTHWRAAAWLLERTDPDRFAKRPPNSCRPETLMDVSSWLIETALEATAPEQRETVYRRMHAVSDKALDVLMPDQHDVRRCLVGALPHRPMPLSDHEFTKTLRVVQDDSAPEIGAQPAQAPTANPGAHPSTHIQNFRLLDSADMDADWRYPLPDEDADSAHHKQGVAPVAGGSPTGVAQRQEALPENPPVPVGTQVGEDANLCHPRAPQPAAGHASHTPPNEGIMSPKMSAATECDATECETAGVGPVPAVAALHHDGNGIMPHQAGDGIARHKAGDGIAGLKSA